MSAKSKTKAKSVTPAAELPFEQAFQELDELVKQLESGELSLDESLALYERGQALAARCQSLLETAELKIQTLTAEGLKDFESAEA
jgi:exodeoxyribonuclease VII small subunit